MTCSFLVALCNCSCVTVAMGVVNDYFVALSCLCSIRRMLDYTHTRIKAVRFDLSSEGEGDPVKLLKSTTHSTATQQVTVSLLLWLAMLIAIPVALSRSPQRLSWWRVYWPGTSIFAIRVLDAARFHHILRTDLVDDHCFRQSGRFLLEMRLLRACRY